VLILTGDTDDLISPVNSEWLAKNMPGADHQVWPGTGHGVIGQEYQKFNELLEKVIQEGREKGSQAPFV
jgi:pimeloyl-ACP methyl ester carboxylesterase